MTGPVDTGPAVTVTVRDELDIRNLIARMAHATDRGTIEEYGALLADDVRWVMPGVEPVTTRDAIVNGAIQRRASNTTGPDSGKVHLVSTTAVEVHGDRAAATSCWQFLDGRTTPPSLLAIGIYRDVFARGTDGRWLFAERSSSLP